MGKKLPEEVIAQMWDLYTVNKLTVAEIAEKTGYTRSCVYGYTRAKERGFSSPSQYQEWRAQQNGFDDIDDYQRDRAEQKGFSTRRKYQQSTSGNTDDGNLRRRKYTYETRPGPQEYKQLLASSHGFSTYSDYLDAEADKEGYANYNALSVAKARERSQRPLNKMVSTILYSRVQLFGYSYSRLAREVGITESVISKYLKGERLPSKRIRPRLFGVLHLPYETLDDVLCKTLVE